VLSTDVVTLPIRFRQAGYTTAGFTEGGYTAGVFGFDRGFDTFSDATNETSRAFEETLDKAREFLRSLGPNEPFFLFVHTYAVHDPYAPVAPYPSMFWDEAIPDVFEPNGSNLVAVNRGDRELSADGARYFSALYDAGIRYADDRLAEFWGTVEELGLDDETTLVVTSDHGEEFLEHGQLVHEQVYPETVHVPLLIAHPELGAGRRVESLVESIDIAPTLYELAGFEDQPPVSGSSLARYLFGAPEPEQSQAYAEAFVTPTKTFLWRERDTYQLVYSELLSEAGGYWGMPAITFDWSGPELDIQLRGFRKPRRVSVSADGQLLGSYDIAETRTPLRVRLPQGGRHDITIRGGDCDSPASLGVNEDTRCMSFFVYADDLTRTQLYALDRDPLATEDIGREHPDFQQLLVDVLTSRQFARRATPGAVTLDEETIRRLRALGYLR
jgi:hypothetical protein